jgi:hypothetical protein
MRIISNGFELRTNVNPPKGQEQRYPRAFPLASFSPCMANRTNSFQNGRPSNSFMPKQL